MNKLKIYYFVGLLFVSAAFLSFIFPAPFSTEKVNTFQPMDEAQKWVDSVFNGLTEDQRTAQLFMVAAYSKQGVQPEAKIEKLIKEYNIGGLIFMQGGPGRQAILTNYYQSITKTPLMIGIDGEWGVAMRLDSTMHFPWQMTMGAVQNDTLIYEMGRQVALQCKRLGIHVNFAPSVDVNNNPNNPIIGARSFGENKYKVADKGIAYALGMQQERVMACAKHFPGHGDTDKDSHKTLPQINKTAAQLDSLELYPFKKMIEKGVKSFMIAHLAIPSLDNSPNTPTTLSKKVVTDLLQTKMGFKGLIFTDALNMKGVADLHAPGEVDAKALIAGNDVLLFAGDVPTAIKKINEAIDKKEITRAYVHEKCKKILYAKYWLGLNKKQKINLKNLDTDLNNAEADLIARRLTQASLTVLKNDKDVLPLMQLDTMKIAAISIGEDVNNAFQNRLADYAKVSNFTLNEGADAASFLTKLKGMNRVIISVHKSNKNPFQKYKLSDWEKLAIKTIAEKFSTIVCLFANPYALRGFDEIKKAQSVVMSYQNSEIAQDYTAQLLFGGIPASGKLPVTVSASFPEGSGIELKKKLRFRYVIPEEIGIKTEKLRKVDTLMKNAIKEGIFPGAQILVAKDGNVFYQKSFGYHTYEPNREVRNTDLYDIASVTKITTSLLAFMKLYDEKKISLQQTLGDFLPELKDSTDKANLTFIDMLTHQARLKAWIPFYRHTQNKDNSFKDGFYSTTPSDSLFPYHVADNLYGSYVMDQFIYQSIVSVPLESKKKYLYSDVGYYFLKRIFEKITKQKFDVYLENTFYKSMGAYRFTYNPLQKFDKDELPPTELDSIFRKQLIKGYVHDQGAAMLGGVAGHAGIFATANDLGKIMQMYLNGGSYGGKEYIKKLTIEEFSKCQFCPGNRRAVGFDKPLPSGNGANACDCVSQKSFGHTGFTGTMAWADPQNGLVFIFLSNRVYPDANNQKIIKTGLRAQVQKVFYDALK